ncbi:MAG TPA: peptidyl-prolyl cis-trans isomerase [Caulobacteraceae bacterium]
MTSARRRPFWSFGLLVMLARPPYRPMALALIAAVAGLCAAGFDLSRAAHADATSVPPGDVALVNGEPILTQDFITQTEQETRASFAQTSPAQRAHVLHEMVDEELMVQRSLALNLPQEDSEARTSLVDAIDAQVVAPVTNARPSDDELKAYYQAHRDRYASEGSMSLTDLVLHVGGYENADQTVAQAMADAQQAAYELRSGATLDYLKSHFGFVDNDKANGLDADFAAKIYLGPKLFAVAETLTSGQISYPVPSSDGVHLLIMHQRQAPVLTGFEDVRDKVFSDYQVERENRAKRQNLDFLRRSAQILLSPGQKE